MQMWVVGQQVEVKLRIQLVKGGSVAYGNVVNLINGFWMFSGGGQQVDLSHVLNEAEVATGFSIAIDVDGLAFNHARNPLWDDCCIGAIGVLAGTKDVKVAKADGAEAVGAGEHIGIELVDVLCYRIW